MRGLFRRSILSLIFEDSLITAKAEEKDAVQIDLSRLKIVKVFKADIACEYYPFRNIFFTQLQDIFDQPFLFISQLTIKSCSLCIQIHIPKRGLFGTKPRSMGYV